MPHLARLGTGTSIANVTSVASTLSVGAAVGTTVVGVVGTTTVSSVIPTLTIADSKGHTWTQSTPSVSATLGGVIVFFARITTALVAGDTITVTGNSARNRWSMDIHSFDDVSSAPAIDKQAQNNAGTSTAINGGTTAATTSADEVVFGAFVFGGVPAATFTAGFGFASSGTVDPGATSSNRAVALEWKYVSATGTQQATATLSPGSTYAGLTATLPVTPGAPPVGGRSGKARVWNGSAWEAHPAKVWTGSAWVAHPMKGWDGSQWVTAR